MHYRMYSTVATVLDYGASVSSAYKYDKYTDYIYI